MSFTMMATLGLSIATALLLFLVYRAAIFRAPKQDSEPAGPREL